MCSLDQWNVQATSVALPASERGRQEHSRPGLRAFLSDTEKPNTSPLRECISGR